MTSRRRFSIAAATLAAVVLIGVVVRPHAQVGSNTASAFLDAAKLTARQEGKGILVAFSASWCGWCERFDAFVTSPDVGRLVSGHFVILKLIVQERPDKRHLNTLGAQTLMDDWGGSRSGLPFYVFLDANGEKIAGSNAMPNGSNVGYPSTPAEIEAFLRLLERSAPRMTADERARIAQYLKDRAGT
jgi:uncharacterized protein YyaL (SSP411 family)